MVKIDQLIQKEFDQINKRLAKLEASKTETKSKADPKSDAKDDEKGEEGKPSVPSPKCDCISIDVLKDAFTNELANLASPEMKTIVQDLDEQITKRKITDKTGLYSHYGIIGRNAINNLADKLRLWK